MMKFFKRIRQRMLTENNFSKYLIYAIGEIFLLVIGILIALYINNKNIERINKNNERIILADIKKEIQLDTLDIVWNLKVHKAAFENEQKLLFLLNSETNEHSVSIDYTTALGTPVLSAFNTATYSALSYNNPDLITNQALKKMIYRHYDLFYAALTEIENRSSDFNFYSRLTPYYEKYFKLGNDTLSLNFTQNNVNDYLDQNYKRNTLIPNDLDSMRKDDGFKVALSEVIFLRSIVISVYSQALNRIETLSNEIDKELEK